MLISDIMYLFCEESSQEITIFNLYNGDTLYEGQYGDYDGEDYEICSIDNIGKKTWGSDKVVFNVNPTEAE